jgi:hypothetical protein
MSEDSMDKIRDCGGRIYNKHVKIIEKTEE